MGRNLLADFKVAVQVFGVLLGFAPSARAETVRIVALGASDANGHGVGAGQAWPAQLENMLRAKGYDVSMSVNAADGRTSEQILTGAASAASGARIVVFDTGGSNDRAHGSSSQTAGNIAQIIAQIRAQGAVPIQTRHPPFSAVNRAVTSFLYDLPTIGPCPFVVAELCCVRE